MGNTGMPCCEKLSLGSMAVLSGELLSGKAHVNEQRSLFPFRKRSLPF